MTAQEQQKLDTMIAMQMDALGPVRLKKLSTTCYKSQAAYVPGATLRLRDLGSLIKQGWLTSEEVGEVKAWRDKSVVYFNIICADRTIAATAALEG